MTLQLASQCPARRGRRRLVSERPEQVCPGSGLLGRDSELVLRPPRVRSGQVTRLLSGFSVARPQRLSGLLLGSRPTHGSRAHGRGVRGWLKPGRVEAREHARCTAHHEFAVRREADCRSACYGCYGNEVEHKVAIEDCEKIDLVCAIGPPLIVPVAAASMAADTHIPRTRTRLAGAGLHLDSFHTAGRLQEEVVRTGFCGSGRPQSADQEPCRNERLGCIPQISNVGSKRAGIFRQPRVRLRGASQMVQAQA